MDAALMTIKSLPDTSKIEPFDGTRFKRWHEKVFDTLDVMNLAEYLALPPPDDADNDQVIDEWKRENKVCRHTILSTLFNELYDVYCSYKSAHEIWTKLNHKYVNEDAGSQKYVIGNFLNFQMNDEKNIS